MSEKKQMPKCPYCGAEMKIEKPIFAHEYDYDASLVGAKAGWCTQATCTKCWSVAPFVYGTETEKDAYEVVREKAMMRWQEPNRVLTLEEVLEIARQNEDGYNHVCWLEEEIICLISIPGILEGRGSRDGVYVNFDFNEILIKKPTFVKAEEYGKTWRCWMRNPTEQEMRDTSWEV